MRARSAASILAVGFLFFATTNRTHAQLPEFSNSTAAPVPGSDTNYIKLLSETVDPANGSASIRISVPIPKGRGPTLPFSFAYDSGSAVYPQALSTPGRAGWITAETTPPAAPAPFFANGGWSYTVPQRSYTLFTKTTGTPPNQLSCTYTTNYVFEDGSGARHSMPVATSSGSSKSSCPKNVLTGTDDIYYAGLDGSSGVPTIADPDGTIYYFSSNGLTSALASYIEDRNGNKITLTPNPSVVGALTVEDTLGRTVFQSSGFGTTGNTVTIAGLSSAYTVTWGTATVNFSVTSTGSNPAGECSPLPAASASFPVITAIELPNGQKYQFTYDPNYGTVSKIVYPSGGYVSYTWGLNSQAALITFPVSSGTATCNYIYDKPAVLHRYVSFDGSTTALQQDFTFSTVWNSNQALGWTSKQTTVTTHDLVRGTVFSTIHSYNGVPAPEPPYANLQGQNDDAEIPQESQTVYQDVGGAVLETVNKTWHDLFVISSQQTTLGASGGPTSEVTYTYGPGDLVTQKQEYDFGSGAPGSLLRKTVTNYQTFGITPIFPAAVSIFDRPCQTIVYDSSGTNRVAETDYLYDGGTSVCGTAGTPSVTGVSGLPTGTHDETNYASTSSAPRANLTTMTRLCIQSAPACTSGNSATTYTYDETGQVLTMKDPRLNSTQYSYADSYTSGTPPGSTNAYVTQITRPATNGVNHISNYSYGYADGKLTVAKDENGQLTTYAYSTDPLDRLTQTTYPTSGGETAYTYNDTAPTPSITTQNELSAGVFLTTVGLMDGMRHPAQSQLTSDPTGTDYTVTKYDGLGRKYTVTNPYRSTSDPTYGVTTYTYDSIGRTTQVADADGSKVTTSYNGNCSTVTDEASKTRESCTDGVGRMTSVIENPGGLGFTTNYTYDALNDLTSVVQGGSHNRSFGYDSLKRLISSTNPEAGTVTYAYDANSNVITKLDARSITITYAYDALNRITGRTYFNGDPSVSYTYDQASCLGQSACYNIGRRTSMTDAGGSESWAYDQMGRELAEQRTTNSIPKTTAYSYNLGGSLATLTYPSGRTVTYSYDAVARPVSAIDSANSINYATSALYSPAGGLSSIANGASLVSTLYYNTRFQPCRISVKSSGAAPTSCTDTADIANVLDYAYNFSLGTSDNGNVTAITNNIDNTRSQSFTYDQVNRITTAETTSTYATSPANCWGEAYVYDNATTTPGEFGNLTNINVASSGYNGCTQESLSLVTNTQNNNQFTTFSYDASGNTLNDTHNSYTWNAESEIKTAAGVTYTYDGDGDRVEKSNGTLYWYGAGSQVLMETDLNGNLTSEYIYFGAKRVARRDASNNIYYYAEDMLGSSRAITTAAGTVCYNADFYPYGGERPITNTCPQNYKFESKERDAETTNDDFGARYYSSAFGRFISADWSAVPAPVPYANLTNPQTLNLYAMVRDNPETFADLDGHVIGTIGIYAATGVLDFPEQPDDASPQNTATNQNQAQLINIQPNSANPVTGAVDIESGVPSSFTLATSQQLSPGNATLSVSLTNSDGKDIKMGKDTSLGPEVVGDVKNVSTTMNGQTTSATTLNARVTPISPNNDFGKASKSGSANLTFVIVDAKGARFSGSISVSVAPKISGGQTGHDRSALTPLNRTRFSVSP